MGDLAATIGTLGRLIGYPTVSSDSNLDMAAYLAERLEASGAVVELLHDETGAKATVYATMGPEADGGILLSGHTDVVPVADQAWTSDPFTMRSDDGRLFGRGACDMKGFIAAALGLADALAEANLTVPLRFAFTYDEETGCIGAKSLVEDLRKRERRPAIAIIGEPTEMRLIDGHKGCHEYSTVFTGREGHGAAPDRGVNAIEYAVRYARRMLALREDLKRRAPADSRFEPPWTTLNLGQIKGGVAHNVIANRAEIGWDLRPVQASDTAYVKDQLAAYRNDELLPAMRRTAPEADIVTHVVGEVIGLEPMAENAARDLLAELTGANGADTVAFGTEAGLFQSLGIAAVVCGPGSIAQAHKADEFVAVDQLRSCIDMLDRLGKRLI